MARINPKLNLNKTPQNVENSSLVFAKNIKLNKELSICPDSSVKAIKHWVGEDDENPGLVGKIVGVNNKIYFFTHKENENDVDIDSIFEYNEVTEEVKKINCGWKYNGGEIIGCVTVNNTGEEILTISEYNAKCDVPIKHINLVNCKENDDESIYTQTPNIPITNLNLDGYYTCQIPNGVYNFFVRYKIHDEFYTGWFPASKELFIGNHNTINTIQGKLKYTDLNKDSDKSFIFLVEHLYDEYTSLYEKYQIGFTISNDNGIFARSWKEFDISNKTVYFDYNQNDIQEINIDDLLKTNFEIFNSKNIAVYKNKLYIANYKETDFNPTDNYEEDNAEKINISVGSYNPASQQNRYLNNKPLVSDGNYYKYLGTEDESTLIQNILYFNNNYCDSNINIRINHLDSFDRRVINTFEETYNIYEYERVKNSFTTDGILGIYIGTLVDNQPVYYEFYEEGTYIPTLIIDNRIHETFDGSPSSAINKVKKFIEGLSIEQNPKFVFNCFDSNSQNVKIASDDVYFMFTQTKTDVVRLPDEDNQPVWGVKVTKTIYLQKMSCTIKTNLLSDSTSNQYPHEENTNTLLPFVKYDFYLHYVKHNGITTNGYFIDSIIPTLSKVSSFNGILYPTFSHIGKLDDYAACFISMIKSDTIIAECFNHHCEQNETQTGYIHKVDCLELDTTLYNLNDNITIIQLINNDYNIVTRNAKYYSSSDSSKLEAFGSTGYISWENSNNNESQVFVFLENNNTLNKTSLIKVTPYIKLVENESDNVSYSNPFNLNLRGYVCKINKIKTIKSGHTPPKDFYISGNDIFVKNITGAHLELEDYEGSLNILNSETDIEIKSSFNLNYLSLTELITPQIRNYKDNNVDKSELITSVNSMISSSIYTLQSMYKNYRIKTYSKLDKKKLNVFNNTVRSSNIDSDENYRDVYTFDATDYYNIPTNRGIIVNLFSIINKIYVHTEHAIFVFTDNNMMKVGDNLYTSNTNDITLQETEPFKIGVQEIFDSEYGYGGLQDKKHSLITFNSYIFYDKLAKTIYAYGGEAQLTPISDSIDKILKWFEPSDIYFAADNANDRFFINLRKLVNINDIDVWKNICLSFNFTSKSFVSIHDIDFDYSFNSRINTYFQLNTKETEESEIVYKSYVFKINNSIGYINDYNILKKTSALTLNDVDNNANENIVANSIDILCNTEYEKTKTLNWINWICREIETYSEDDAINLAEEIGKKYSGHFIRVYSDETYSDLQSLTNNLDEPLMSNDVSLSVNNGKYNPALRTYPRYNCGVWSMNNFRDIKNTNNRELVSDNMSLIYGKYFVVRFIFKNKNFKFENIKFNMGNYEKN